MGTGWLLSESPGWVAFKPKCMRGLKHFNGMFVSSSVGVGDKVFNPEKWQQTSNEKVNGYIYQSKSLAVFLDT